MNFKMNFGKRYFNGVYPKEDDLFAESRQLTAAYDQQLANTTTFVWLFQHNLLIRMKRAGSLAVIPRREQKVSAYRFTMKLKRDRGNSKILSSLRVL
jgi:hypothetical protein